MEQQKSRLLVVEDDRPLRSALDIALRQEGYEVLAEADGSRIEQASNFRPDLAILDVHLGNGPDGYQVAAALREIDDVPFIFLTASDTLAARLAGFRAGADDYLVKPFSMDELLARVQALLRRSGRLSSSARQVADLVIDERARVVTRGGEQLPLTRTEFDLLWVLAQRPGQVLSKNQLLSAVWGFDAYDTNLIEVHMSTLRRKIEAHGPRLVHTVRGVGYVLRA